MRMTFLSKIALEPAEVEKKVVSFISSGNADCALCARSPVKVEHKHFLLQSGRLIDPNEAPKPTVIKCGQCNNASVSLMCSQCNSCFYCSHECQTSHWSVHSSACSASCAGKLSQNTETNHHTSPVKCDLSSSEIMSSSMVEKSGDSQVQSSPGPDASVKPQTGEVAQSYSQWKQFATELRHVGTFNRQFYPFPTPRTRIDLGVKPPQASTLFKSAENDLSSNAQGRGLLSNVQVGAFSTTRPTATSQGPPCSVPVTSQSSTAPVASPVAKQPETAIKALNSEETVPRTLSAGQTSCNISVANSSVQQSTPSLIPVPVVEVTVPPSPIITPVVTPVAAPAVCPAPQPVQPPVVAPMTAAAVVPAPQPVSAPMATAPQVTTPISAPVEKVPVPGSVSEELKPAPQSISSIANSSTGPATNSPATPGKDVFDGIISHSINLELNKPSTFNVVWNSELEAEVFFISPLSPDLDTITSVCASTRGDMEFGAVIPIADPKPGTFCLSKQDGDPALYRAKVVETTESGQVKVFFIDYGNFDTTEKNKVWPLPASISPTTIAPQAYPCRGHDAATKQALLKSYEDFTEINLQQLKKDGNIYTAALA